MIRLVLLSGRDMLTREAMHRCLSRAFGFPAYYGNNLDALRDCLAEQRDVQVCLSNAHAMLDHLGDYGRQAIKLMSEAAALQPRFFLLVRG